MKRDISVPLSRPSFSDNEEAAVSRVLKSGWVTQGPEVLSLEEEFSSFVGSKYACAVSNCTSGLFMALTALGVTSADEVITVTHSFIATANVIIHRGASPIFVDIEEGGYNIDVSRVDSLIGERTKAIIAVHQFGVPCDIKALALVAKKRGIFLVEDAACALGSFIEEAPGRMRIGNPIGDAVCFSFHPRKVLTTGDGGMITTNSATLDSKFRLLRQHGMSVSDLARHGSKVLTTESYEEIGYNFRLTDIQAAVGRAQLGTLSERIARRARLASIYLNELPVFFKSLSERDQRQTNWQSYPVRLPNQQIRDSLASYLKSVGVGVKKGIQNIHSTQAYKRLNWKCKTEACITCPKGACQRLPNSEKAQNETLLLPMFCDMSEGEQSYVLEAIHSFVNDFSLSESIL